MPQLIIAILVIAAVCVVVGFILMAVLYICINVVVAADKILGSFSLVPLPVSWGIMGFLFASLLYFAFIEAPRLKKPTIKPLIIFGVIGIAVVFMITGLAARDDERMLAQVKEMARKNELGSEYLAQAREMARQPGKESESLRLKNLAAGYLGDTLVNSELPESVTHNIGSYTFNLKAGEQTPYWIVFPDGKYYYKFNWESGQKIQRLFASGKVYDQGDKVEGECGSAHRFKLRAITDANITFIVSDQEIIENDAAKDLPTPDLQPPPIAPAEASKSRDEKLAEDKNKDVDVNKYNITVQSFPSGASVFINKKEAGITPLPLNLLPGSYGISLKKYGYKNKWAILKVGDESNKSMLYELEKE